MPLKTMQINSERVNSVILKALLNFKNILFLKYKKSASLLKAENLFISKRMTFQAPGIFLKFPFNEQFSAQSVKRRIYRHF